MNIVLLITVTLALTLVHAKKKHNFPPCQEKVDFGKYEDFLKKHIVQDKFPRDSNDDWAKYLKKNELCDRLYRKTQSFLEESDEELVRQICNGEGKQLKEGGDLCISELSMVAHVLQVDQNCKVTGIRQITDPVIVACDITDNRCLPVHFQEYMNQIPPLDAKPCKPA